MVNLIYRSFPFGNGEIFAEYEIPYLNESQGTKYRVFSFYKGKNHKIDSKIQGEVYIIKPYLAEYLKAFFSFFCPFVLNELKYMNNRECRDSILKCLWRMLYYRAHGYAFMKKVKNIGMAEDDVFVSYWLNECAYAAVMLKDKYKKIKVVSRAHGFDVFEERCYLPYRNEIFSKIDEVLPINKIEKQYILDRYNHRITENRIQVSHLGINLPDKYSLNDNRMDFTIVTCSSIIHLKRLDLMIEALSEIKEFSFKWIHIGDGPLKDNIIKMAESKLCEKNQRFEFLGQLALTMVHRFYEEHEVSIFVNCSDTEGVPVSIMEAMSYGIPVIAREVGGNSEIVNTYNGILLNTKCTSHDLAEAIKSIYFTNDCDYKNKRRAARLKVENEFNADYQYRCFFKEVMKP